MNKLSQRKQHGFTIIEVLIVLAIAGLILLVVFMAVPALQRNSRNTSLRNDAQTLMGYVSDFQANNSGAAPTCLAVATDGSVTLSSGAQASPCTGLNSTTPGKIRAGSSVVPTTPPATLVLSTIYIGLSQKCNGTGNGFSSSSRSAAALFLTETPGAGAVPPAPADAKAQCVAS